MRRFAQLFEEMDASNKTLDKVDALRRYFLESPAESAVWGLWLLLGNRFPNKLRTRDLRTWVAFYTDLPPWLVEDCYERVGDLAETLTLLLPLSGEGTEDSLAEVISQDIQPLGDWEGPIQQQRLQARWKTLNRSQAFVFHKILTGGFRVGASRQLVTRALGEALGVPKEVLAHRLMGKWQPTAEFFEGLKAPESALRDPSRPYPFFLASPLDGEPAALGSRKDWLAEWKWDGIRAQLVKRQGQVFLWSRGEELLSARFPEIMAAAARLPNGVVLDGEILCWRGDLPLPFNTLQTRIQRKRPAGQWLAAYPAVFLAYDCIESEGADLRQTTLAARRSTLEKVLAAHLEDGVLRLSPLVETATWEQLAELWEESRDRGVEGLMLKARNSHYQSGRVKGDWWKWKVAPYTADLVMIYAQAGHGRRASQYTDYTLAAREGDDLVPVAKAYSGLSHEEIAEVDRWVKAHTLSRFGPVRTVPGELVFEIAFEGIQRSTRHKSGIALRFPRIHRWRKDKKPTEADSVETLQALLAMPASARPTPAAVEQLAMDFD
jgi:DNA ligase-1